MNTHARVARWGATALFFVGVTLFSAVVLVQADGDAGKQVVLANLGRPAEAPSLAPVAEVGIQGIGDALDELAASGIPALVDAIIQGPPLSLGRYIADENGVDMSFYVGHTMERASVLEWIDILLADNRLRLDFIAREPDGHVILAFHLWEPRPLPPKYLAGDEQQGWLLVRASSGTQPEIRSIAPDAASVDPIRYWLTFNPGYDGILGVSDDLLAMDNDYRRQWEEAIDRMRPTVSAALTAEAR